jgi:16S rRNA (uracil1498-N3)-methyltransferase
MTRRRFYAPPERFSADGTSVRLGTEETRHLRNVLRLKAGDEIYLFDGLGREFSGEVQTIARDSTEVSLIKEVDAAQPESGLNLTLAVALLKGEKFDLVIQKATELGVARVIPLITARADVRIKSADDAARKTTRWQRIALEATKQCGRARLMTIELPVTFADQVKTGGDASLMFAERDGIPFAETLSAGLPTAGVTALVGPEGGWTDEEIAQARDSGWKIVTLGGRILRAETAAIVVATLIQYRFGDLS